MAGGVIAPKVAVEPDAMPNASQPSKPMASVAEASDMSLKAVGKQSQMSLIRTSNEVNITGFAKHGLNRVIEHGVNPSAILDALKNPLKVGNIVVDQLGRQSQHFVGRYCEVVINPKTGQIISVNPTSSAKAARLLKQLSE